MNLEEEFAVFKETTTISQTVHCLKSSSPMKMKLSITKSEHHRGVNSSFRQSLVERLQKRKDDSRSFQFLSINKLNESNSDIQDDKNILTELVDYSQEIPEIKSPIFFPKNQILSNPIKLKTRNTEQIISNEIQKPILFNGKLTHSLDKQNLFELNPLFFSVLSIFLLILVIWNPVEFV